MKGLPPRQTEHGAYSELRLHRHARGYIAVVLSGHYDEHSPDGRFACPEGTVVAHPVYHLHSNRFSDTGAVVLNLPVPPGSTSLGYCVASTSAPEALARMAHDDRHRAGYAAVEVLTAGATAAANPPAWLARMATQLRQDAVFGVRSSLQHLAVQVGVSAEHASRAFRDWYGLSPVRFRREYRIRRALFMLEQGQSPVDVAIACGFSDQPHLTRELRRATGTTPAVLTKRRALPD